MCVSVWCSGLCSRFPMETLRVRSPPSAVTHVFLLLLYLWVATNSQMCMSEYECVVGGKKKYIKKWNCRWPKTATGSCVVQDQAPQQWWSFRSALQPDWWCNSGTSNMRLRIMTIIVYNDGSPKVQRCVYVYVCAYMCGFVVLEYFPPSRMPYLLK